MAALGGGSMEEIHPLIYSIPLGKGHSVHQYYHGIFQIDQCSICLGFYLTADLSAHGKCLMGKLPA